MKSRAMVFAGLSGLLSSVVVSTAGAQGAGRDVLEEIQVLEEVVVTAEKRPEDLQKTSTQINAYSGEQMRQEGKRRVEEMLSGLAGVQLQPGPGGTNFNMRGFDGGANFQAQSDVSGTAGVAFVVDGVYQPRTDSTRAGAMDMMQVEVMRGTQSTTIGGNSLIGAVNLTSNQPQFQFGAAGSVETGNFNLLRTDGMVNVPINDQHALRLAFQTEKRDGYVSSNRGNIDSKSVRLRYRWQATDDLNIVVTAETSRVTGLGGTQGNLLYQGYWTPYNAATDSGLLAINRGSPNTGIAGLCVPTNPPPISQATGLSNGVCGVMGYQPGTTASALYVFTLHDATGAPLTGNFNSDQYLGLKAVDPTYRQRSNPWDDGLRQDGFGFKPHSTNSSQSYSVSVDWDVGFATLTAVPSYQKTSVDQLQAPVGMRIPMSRTEQKTEQLDLRLASSPDFELFKWLSGAAYFHTNAPNISGNQFYPGFNLFGQATNACPSTATSNCFAWQHSKEVTQTTKSIYGNVEYPIPFVDGLRAMAGVRYQEDRKTLIWSAGSATLGASNGPTTPGSASNPVNTGDYSGPVYSVFNYFNPLADQPHGDARWHHTVYSTGFEYDVQEDIMAYAKFATGYQPGQVPSSGTITPTLKQTTRQWTAGFKSRFLENRLQFNLEAFRTDFTNYLLQNGQSNQGATVTSGQPVPSAADPIPCQFVGRGGAVSYNATTRQVCVTDIPNAKTLQTQGVDFDVSWLLTNNDRVNLAAEYLKTEIKEISVSTLTVSAIDSGLASNTQFAAIGYTATQRAQLAQMLYDSVVALQQSGIGGQTLQNSPKWSVTASYQHTFQLWNGSKLIPRANLTHKSSYWSSGFGVGTGFLTTGPSTQPTYNLWDFYLNWSSKSNRYNASAYVKNISNYAVLVNYNAGPSPYGTVTLGDPRTYGLNLAAKF